jgi:methionyl aminopeptidase
MIVTSQEDLDALKRIGNVVAIALEEMEKAVEPGRTTGELDEIGARVLAQHGARSAPQLVYNFPGAYCISVNDVVVHGIPGDLVIRDGDILGIDLGVYLDGWHADSANTYAVGSISPEAQRLLNVTKESLYQGIAKARVGNTIGDIGAAIQKYCEGNGYGVVRDLVGHGIGRSVHEEPNVPNFGKAGKGITLREGMILCIEPMINQGTYRVKQLSDKWTVVTADGKLSAHFEHTIAVTKDGPDILTLE